MADRYKDFIIPEEELKRREAEIDLQNLDNIITIKGIQVNTFGELKKYITSYKIIYKLEPFLSDANYGYIYRLYSQKKRGLTY